MEEEIVSLKKHLDKAIKEGDLTRVSDILKKMGKFDIKVDILQSTNIGVSVGKLRKHEDQGLSKLATELVGRWKKIVEKGKEAKGHDGKSEKGTPKKEEKSTTPKKEHEEGGSPRVPSSPSSSFPPPSPLSSSLGSSSSLSSSYFGEFRSKLKDPVRAKVQQFFFEALTFKIENATNYEPGLPLELSEKIERELYDLYGGPTKDYKGQSRKLFLNLKNESNPSFKENVLTGVIDVSKLCRMSPEEMGSEEMIKKRKEHEEAALKNVIVDDSAGQATTDMFRCGKCGERKTTYYQMQTRSADEPMTTFITCTNCKNRWKQN